MSNHYNVGTLILAPNINTKLFIVEVLQDVVVICEFDYRGNGFECYNEPRARFDKWVSDIISYAYNSVTIIHYTEVEIER